ncbi:HCN2 [Symbiodinium natans]|uniref:HCN2 protein n=1 Tax=Symbiodinium natans TaxID=878477 RepID=A0A812LCL9_9DINO|nr:HCN2 [Symbiodinium natans]
MANVQRERELTRWMISSLATRGPVKPCKKLQKPQETSNLNAGAADWSQKEENWSPYMTPAPVWRARQRLPQIAAANVKSPAPSKPTVEATPTLPAVNQSRRSTN